MEPEDLTAKIKTGNPEAIVSEHVLERVPYLFSDDWDTYRTWRLALSEQLGVDQCNIAITGSACAGYSLSPYKSLKPFDNHSDVDVAIVSDYHFTVAWRHLRNLRPHELTDPRERQSLKEHRSHHVYFGCIATDRILRQMPFSRDWVLARDVMRAVPPTENRDINFRIYRDFDSLRSYQIAGIRSLQRNLLENLE